MTRRLLTACALLLSCMALHLAPAYAAGCESHDHCSEVSTFAARLTEFRTSIQGPNRQVIATVSFENKTSRPLILGYAEGSGLGLDEHGNRYTLTRNGLRGIGEIERNRFDSRFTLQPGERADARFELGWHAGREIAGVDFQLEMAIREIDTVSGGQFRLGREHLLSFTGLRDGLATATPAAAAASAAVQPGVAAPVHDPCEGRPACHAAGPFAAEVAQLSTSQERGSHFVQLRVRFRNLGNQPLILGYQQSSGTLLDNYGQKYTVDWRYTQDVGGIGQVTRSSADPQFVLSPGESRMATFNFRRAVGKTSIGTVFSPDLVIEQLEILPSQQVRSTREYAVGFTGLSSSPAPGVAAQEVGNSLKQLEDGLRSIFKKK